MGSSYGGKQRAKGNAKGGSDASNGKPYRSPNIPIGSDNASGNAAYGKNYANTKRQKRGD